MPDRIEMDDDPVILMAQDDMVEVGTEPLTSMTEEPVILMAPDVEEPTV